MIKLNVFNDLQASLKEYTIQLEDAIIPHLLDAFPNMYMPRVSVERIDERSLTAWLVNDEVESGKLKLSSHNLTLVTVKMDDEPEMSASSDIDVTDLLDAWNNFLVSRKCIEFATTEYYRSQLTGLTPYLVRFQARVKDFPASYHAVTVHVLKGETTMEAINKSILSTAQTLYPNSLVTMDEVILVGVLPYSKMAREYYTVDQWGYSSKPEALSVYAKELLNVPVDL